MRLSELLTSSRDGVRRGRRVSRTPASGLRRPSIRPGVERLEEREVPTLATNQAFVATLYEGFLGRAPDLAGLSYWTGQLNNGATPTQVASGILNSTEYRAHEVAWLYQSLLGRAPDLGGLDYFVGALTNGSSLDQVRATILASDEFFARAGGSSQGFLNALFQDILGRGVDTTSQSTFTPAAANGNGGRLQVAAQVLGSSEARLIELQNDYRTALNRPFDSIGAAYWGTALLNGARNESILAGLLGSSEFLTRLQPFASTGADPVQAANQFILANNLFQVVNTQANPGAPTVSPFGTLAPVNAAEAPAVGPVLLPTGFNPAAFVSSIPITPGSVVSSGTTVGTNGTVTTGTTGGRTTVPSTSPLTNLPFGSPLLNLPSTSPLTSLPFGSPLTTGTFGSPLTTGTFGSPLTTGAFGTALPASTFGSPLTTGTFGSPLVTGTFGSPLPASIFGSPLTNGTLGGALTAGSIGGGLLPGSVGGSLLMGSNTRV